jgi:hypothetical protein
MRLLAAVFCLMCLASLSYAATAGDGVEGEWKIRHYRVVVQKSGDPQGGPTSTLTVFHDRKQLYKISNGALWLNPKSFFTESGDSKEPYGVGADVLKLGEPSLVIQGYSRGAHCCFDVTILFLGDHFRAMPTIPLFDAEAVHFRPAKGHKALAMSTEDFTFGYWRASFAESSAAPVTLSFDPKVHHYVPDAELMRAPLPSDLDARITAAKEAQSQAQTKGPGYTPRALTQPILDLAYTGHLNDAQSFLKLAWVGTDAARDDYWSDLTTCQLRLSPFWPTVAKMNGLQPAKPVGKCPRV